MNKYITIAEYTNFEAALENICARRSQIEVQSNESLYGSELSKAIQKFLRSVHLKKFISVKNSYDVVVELPRLESYQNDERLNESYRQNANRVRDLIELAFPNVVNVSDPYTDYFDYKYYVWG